MKKVLFLLVLVMSPVLASADTVAPGEITVDTTWSPNDGVYILESGVTVIPGVTLTIEPGTIIKSTVSVFGAIYWIEVKGSLIVNGTEADSVYFTSIRDDSVGDDTNGDGANTVPSPTNWTGIVFRSGSTGHISHAVIRYSGAFDGFYRAGIFNYGGDVVIENTSFEDNFQADIYQESGSLLVSKSFFDDDNFAVRADNGDIEFFENSLSSGTTFYNNSSVTLDLTNNWWGSDTGPRADGNPAGQGAFISGPSVYSPWLLSEPGAEPERNPVIIIPGIMGSYLNREDGTEVWMNLIDMTLSITDDYLDELLLTSDGLPISNLIPTDIIRKSGFPKFRRDVFDNLINEIVSNGYSENENLFVFPYDWRADIGSNIDSLNERINLIKLTTSSDKVDVIAHSMGGLLVKKFLENNQSISSIGKFIDLGTPHLGSPESFITLNYGDTGIGILNRNKIIEISQNMPSVYQLLPTREYFNFYPSFVSDLDDLDGNGVTGNLTYDQTNQFMVNTGRNSLLLDRADQFHQEIAGLDPRDYGVETYNITGCGLETLGKIFVLDKTKADDIEYRIAYIDGDGTVPLKSAENMPSDGKYYAKGVQHALMPSSSGVKELVISLLTGEDFDISLYPNLNETDSNCGMPDGQMVSFHSPIELHIYDSNGNHTGPDANGDIEYGIPGVGYDVLDGNKFAFLPDGTEYTIKGNATDSGSFNARIETIEDETVIETKYFNNVPLTIETQVEILSDTILLDSNNDGLVDAEVLPSAILDESQSADVVKPVTSIMIDGKKKDRIEPFNKPVKVSFSATDDNSGVLKTEYSLDNGVNWVMYIEPFTIANRGENKVLYKSTDKAGNVELVKSFKIIINPPGGSGGKK